MLDITIVDEDRDSLQALETVTRDVLAELKLEAVIRKEVTLPIDAGMVVFESPVLLINGKIVNYGSIPSSSWLADQIQACVRKRHEQVA